MNKTDKSTLPFYILMFSAMMAWGGAWVSAKVIAGMCSPEIIIFWRYLFTAISMIPILIYRKESLKLDKKTLLSMFGSAIFLIGYSHFFFKGLETGLAGAGGVLLTTVNPIFTYLIISIIFRKRIRQKEWLGLLIGFIGGVFLLRLWQFSTDELVKSGNLFFLLGALFWSFLTVTSQEAQKKSSVFVYSFYLNGIAVLVTAFTIDYSEMAQIVSFPPYFWLNLLYLALIGTTFGTTAYFFSTSKLGAAKGSSFVFLVPVNAVVLSFFFLREKPQWSTLIGGALAVLAVYLIHKKSENIYIEEVEVKNISK